MTLTINSVSYPLPVHLVIPADVDSFSGQVTGGAQTINLRATTAPATLQLPPPTTASEDETGAEYWLTVTDSTFGVSLSCLTAGANPAPCIVAPGATAPTTATVALTAAGATVPLTFRLTSDGRYWYARLA